jgi:mannose-1-phosphate guanylyltransferase / mannose-6-phosphate isomerase
LAGANAYWNSGMFVLRADSCLKELQRQRPDILEPARKAWAARNSDFDFVRPEREALLACAAHSIDYAIM